MMKMDKLFQKVSLDILHMGHASLGKEWLYENFSQNFIKMYFIKGGRGIIRYPHKDIFLEANKLYLIPPFKPANYFVKDAPLEQYFIHFYAKFDNNISIFSLMDFYDCITLDNSDVILHLFKRLNEIYSEPTDFLMVEADSILRYFLSLMRQEHTTKNIEDTLHSIKRFELVLMHLEQNFSRKISLNEMAALLHLQPTYFSTAFTKVFGLSPIEFVISKKLEKAQELLFFTDSSIKEISSTVGFRDEFYFSRIFKKYLGLSPANYRMRRKI